MARRAKTNRTRNFIILVVVTIISGMALRMSGDLINPFEYSELMLGESNTSFDEQATAPEDLGFAMVTLDNNASTTEETPAEGDILTSTSFENALSEGNQTVYMLADYFNFSWDSFGGVLYDLWVMMALTVVVIVVARPVGWVIKSLKQPAPTRIVAEPNA